ncbi:TPA: hypothetical protein MA183_005552 [Klebsiella pneumoniae]|nr:hypothetical protein [Klebsiella pneumoniae]
MTASAVIIPHTAKPRTNPLKTIQKLLCAVGVDPTRRQLQPGRISALAGRRAAYERVPKNCPQLYPQR